MAVLLIAQVQAGRIVHDAAGDGGHLVPDGADEQTLVLDQLVHRAHQRHKSAGDGCRAGSAISFQYVAVQGDGPFAQLGHVHSLAQGTANQPLNFHAAAVFFDAVPLFPLSRGSGEHGILRGDPSLSPPLEKGGHAFLHRCGANDPRVARGDKAAAVRCAHKVRLDADVPRLILAATVRAIHVYCLQYFRNLNIGNSSLSGTTFPACCTRKKRPFHRKSTRKKHSSLFQTGGRDRGGRTPAHCMHAIRLCLLLGSYCLNKFGQLQVGQISLYEEVTFATF